MRGFARIVPALAIVAISLAAVVGFFFLFVLAPVAAIGGAFLAFLIVDRISHWRRKRTRDRVFAAAAEEREMRERRARLEVLPGGRGGKVDVER